MVGGLPVSVEIKSLFLEFGSSRRRLSDGAPVPGSPPSPLPHEKVSQDRRTQTGPLRSPNPNHLSFVLGGPTDTDRGGQVKDPTFLRNVFLHSRQRDCPSTLSLDWSLMSPSRVLSFTVQSTCGCRTSWTTYGP